MASRVRWYVALSLALLLVCGCLNESVTATPTATASPSTGAQAGPESFGLVPKKGRGPKPSFWPDRIFVS